MIDLKQLAARLGLSQTTVSRALNGYTDVSAATRERVARVARELGYQPNLAARRLALGRAEAVGMVYPLDVGGLDDPRFLEVLDGLSTRFVAAGVDLLLVSAHEKTELQTYERLVRGRRVDGLIVARTQVVDPRIAYLREAGVPFVAYGRTGSPEGFAWLDFDNERGSELAVEALAALGHRRFSYVHAPLELNFAHQRHAGFRRAIEAAGLTVDPSAMIATGMNRRNGYAAAQRLLASDPRPTAIVADNNLAGVGVIRALLDGGVSVGRDVSVVVYDGVPADTLLLGEQVASIEQPTPGESGRRIAGMLLDLIEGRPLSQPQVLLAPRYQPGDSAGPPVA